jgi:carbon monoxide dehydrogenase subunit G
MLMMAASGALAAQTEVRVTRRPDKAYVVSGTFTVDASTAIVWGVLTDYDRIPSFVSSMRSSRVRETHADGSLLVEQEAVGDMLFLSRTMRVLLAVRRSPGKVHFTDVGRKDFTMYDGDWEARRTSAGTAVSYRLLAAPRFLAPAFIASRAMKRGAQDLLDQVRAEIVRREPAK